MSQFSVKSLSDLTTSEYDTEIAANKPQSAGSVQQMIRDIEGRISQLNDFWQARASNQAAASAPPSTQAGELFYNTTSSLLLLDPDGSGADAQVATELDAKSADFSHAGGAAAFKVGGAINVDTSNVTASAPPSTVHSYSVPANTLNANQDAIPFLWWGRLGDSVIGGGAPDVSASVKFGSSTLHTISFTSQDGISDQLIWEGYVVRTAAGSQKAIGFGKYGRDNMGSTSWVAASSSSENETAANTLEIEFTSRSISSGTMEGQAFVVKFEP